MVHLTSICPKQIEEDIKKKKDIREKKKTSIQRVSEGGDDNDSETKTELTRLHVIEEELPRYPGTPQQVSQKELNCV